jgi:hypothetical protein
MSFNKIIIDQHGTEEETSFKAHVGLKAMHGDNRVA